MQSLNVFFNGQSAQKQVIYARKCKKVNFMMSQFQIVSTNIK